MPFDFSLIFDLLSKNKLDPKNYKMEENPTKLRVIAAGFSPQDIACIAFQILADTAHEKVFLGEILAQKPGGLDVPEKAILNLYSKIVNTYLNLHEAGVFNHDHIRAERARLAALIKSWKDAVPDAEQATADVIAKAQRHDDPPRI